MSSSAPTIELIVPGSKSESLRALLAASMADGRSVLRGVLDCDDSDALIRSCRALGARFEPSADGLVVVGVGYPLAAGPRTLDAGESGAVARFLIALLCTGSGEYAIRLHGRLPERSLTRMDPIVRQLGGHLDDGSRDTLMVVANPARARAAIQLGPLGSSQPLSAVLLAGPMLPGGVRVEHPGVPSSGYVDLTIDALARFGVQVDVAPGAFTIADGSRYQAADWTIPGDWSSAGYLLGAATLTGRPARLAGLDPSSRQPDRAVVDLLRASGAELEWLADGSLTVAGGLRHPFHADFDGCPDLAPLIAALAATIPGHSRLDGVGRLRDKESDRIAAMVGALMAVGVCAWYDGRSLHVDGGRLRGAAVDGARDHRVVMSLSLLGLLDPQILVGDRPAVRKSFPGFFDAIAPFRRRSTA